MADVEQIYLFVADLDLDLRNKLSLLDLLELRLDPVALRLWAVDLTDVRSIWEMIDLVAGYLILLLLILVRLGTRRQLHGHAIVAIADCMDPAFPFGQGIRRREDDAIILIHRRKRLFDDDGNWSVVAQQVFKLEVSHSCSFQA